MDIKSWLNNATQLLLTASVGSARLDAEILLADAMNNDRSWVLAHPEITIQADSLYLLDSQIQRRMTHEPLAYIRGRQEFYGRDFIVSPDTLTPRPETETLVVLVMNDIQKSSLNGKDKLQIIDVGTGSGCILISLALELSTIKDLQPTTYTGLDISMPALKIAKQNADILNADVVFTHFDLLNEPLDTVIQPESAVYVVANLPYVPTDFHINLAATHEPKFAIFGGVDGLEYYRVLFEKLGAHTKTVVTESLPPQHQGLEEIAMRAGFGLEKSQDLIQVFKRT